MTRDAARFDYYAYWEEMRGNPADARFWGNRLINDSRVGIPSGVWTCVEVMVKLNDPAGARNGELALWIDGKQVSYLAPGNPKGRWVWDNFIPDPSGTPFEGFRWRSDSALGLNWIRLFHYVSQDPAGYKGMIWFDQVIAATVRIGCMASAPVGALEKRLRGADLRLVPGPGRSFSLSVPAGMGADPASLQLTDPGGRRIGRLSIRRSGDAWTAKWTGGGDRAAMVIVSLRQAGGVFRRKIALLGG